MKRILISFFISLFFHVAVFAAIVTVKLLEKPQTRITNIMYIKPVKITKIKSVIKKTETKKAITKKIEAKKTVTTKLITKNEGIKKTIKKKIVKKPIPKATPVPTPYPTPTFTPDPKKSSTPVIIKKAITKKPKIKTKEQIEEETKIVVLKKYPYFKNWSAKRLKRLPLPPGMKSWAEAAKMTDYLDKEYNWTGTPPNLGNTDNKIDPDKNPYETPIPTPTPTDDPNTPNWKEYKDSDKVKVYNIRFYYEKVGFIATLNENDKKVYIQYFPFDSEKSLQDPTNQTGEVEIKVSPETKKENIKKLELPLTQIEIDDRNTSEKDKAHKDQLVRDILRAYRQTLPNN